MSTATTLIKEIETLPEESMAAALDFILSLKNKPSYIEHPTLGRITIEDAYGIFKGIDTHFERDEDDRV